MTGPLAPAPAASDDVTRRRFQRQRRRDTDPEVTLRRLLHARGLRYRIDARPLPDYRRRADIVFTRARVAVFLDGCFWHHCPDHGSIPHANATWWTKKLERNVVRDRDTDARLVDEGWAVLRVWEHEDPSRAADRVEDIVCSRRWQVPSLASKSADVVSR